ncbi:recombinase family protein [Aneurinibacillus soli]|uniref:recombinase family protein n=1 Tax=Aneurinibacillus soli TaxID=1500254 RepID=UPI000BBA589B|nr:recombinase family protein [Aneurinibacillus soli]
MIGTTAIKECAMPTILKNDFYKGVLRHGDVIIEGSHTPLVNKIVFGKVQALLKGNRMRGEEDGI